MNAYDTFNNVLNSKNLFQLADSLEGFIDCLNDTSEKKRILDNCYHMLTVRIFFEHKRPYSNIQVYNEPESVLEYLYNYWVPEKTVKENITMLKRIIEEIRTHMLLSKTRRISEQAVGDLFALIDNKFQYGSKVLQGSPLKILQFNNTHKDWNCYYSATILGDELTKDYVMMTCPHKPQTRQEFGFAHELGHKLHTSLTKKLFTAPASFDAFKRFFEDSKEDKSKSMDEHFADVFAIAALSNSPYEHCIPFKVNPKNTALFTLYIAITILTMDENIVHSIEELHELAYKLDVNLG